MVDRSQDSDAPGCLIEETSEGKRKRARSLQLQVSPLNTCQTDFAPGSGNALQACVASLFGLPLTGVPNFVTLSDYLTGITEFVAPVAVRKVSPAKLESDDMGKLCILRGKSPRGAHGHVVVARIQRIMADTGPEFDFVHDPHPDGNFLDASEPYGWVMLFESTQASG
eukprot:TRINITY_DN77905_c0_g1_i1.p1 TRINITY_DN77905_c0_g1~~TRINITY_DN77905_c0_g1_i1.p1  ORF type:complete len:168 (+),score=15.09 TRINITY_DN77905_c0_g1_i1:139-642(+)